MSNLAQHQVLVQQKPGDERGGVESRLVNSCHASSVLLNGLDDDQDYQEEPEEVDDDDQPENMLNELPDDLDDLEALTAALGEEEEPVLTFCQRVILP